MTPRIRLLVTLLAVVVLAAVAVVVVRLLDEGPTRLQAAAALAPEESERILWTDWAGVRDELGADLAADSPPEQVAAFLSDAFEADLSATSALAESSPTLHEQYGVSPATLDWELLTQGEAGQLILMGLSADVDLDALRDRLAALGYAAPSDGQPNWEIDPAGFARIGTLTPEFRHLQVDEEHRVLVASDDPAYLATWQDHPRGTDVDDGIGDVLEALADPDSAVVYSGDHVCGALAMSQASPADIARGDQLLAAAGEVHPIRGFAMAATPGGDVAVVMAFEDEEDARTDADTRAELAAGPAPGQGGDFSERFSLGEVSADGRIVRMELAPTEGAYVISDLSSGPVLFATC